jgi:outer membrane protein, multidrug efflux system
MVKSTIAACSLALLVGGCAIGPDYVKPKIDEPSAFATSKAEQNLSQNLSKEWWKLFGDAKLNEYVEEALRANKDLKIANLQVEQMLAQFDQVESSLYPQVYAGGSLLRQKQSETTPQKGLSSVTNTYTASLSLVSYELDLWGKVRRANEAAKATLMSSEYAKEGVRLSIVSSVVDSYMKLVLANEQSSIAKENAEIAGELARFAQKKYDIGYISLIELSGASSSEQVAKSSFFAAQIEVIRAQNRLNLLLGKNPSPVVSSLSTSSLGKTPKVPEGLASGLIAKRPDVAQAEEALIASNAQIGIAKAAYFPSISLTAAFGQQSAEFDSLFKGPSRMWNFAPNISVPLFTAGRISASVRSAESASEQAVVAYEKVVQGAFAEVDTALNAYIRGIEQEEATRIQEEAAAKIYELSLAKYEAGQIALPTLLGVKQSWLAGKQALANASINAKSGAVTLIKALGGGWEKK